MPEIKIDQSRVLHTRERKNKPGLRRRREMLDGTGMRFTTVEMVIPPKPIIVYNDRGEAPWNPKKLHSSIEAATMGMLDSEQVGDVVARVVRRAFPQTKKGRGSGQETARVPVATIRRAVFDELRGVNEAVAIRWGLGRDGILPTFRAVKDYLKDW